MQVIDSNDFNLRTAAYLLTNGTIEFLIIPVVHIGSKEFYKEVTKELDKCDIILFEGIGLKAMNSLGNAYKRCAKRLGLKYQNDEIDLKKYTSKIIHADYAGESAENEWKKIPFISRLMFRLLFPVGLTILAYTQTRRSFVKSFRNKEDIDDQLWFMNYGKSNSVDNFIMRKREQVILEKINEQLSIEHEEPTRIGIIYGAGHMRKVILYLTETHKFNISDSWFLTVLWLTDPAINYKHRENEK